MSAKWPRVQIFEVCELIVDCVNKTAPRVDYETPYKMIRTPNIRNGRVDLSDCRYVEKETYEKWTRRATVEKGDVLLTREAPMGEVGRVTFNDTAFLGQRVMQYRANEEVLDSRFLLYSFLSPDLQHQFRMHDGSGSVVSHIRVPDCSKFELNLPPLNEQKRIADILNSLDDKIEMNRQMNATLEEMAQALFKQWFVDFEFPFDFALGRPSSNGQPYKSTGGKMIASELGPIPEGWAPTILSKMIELIGGGTPKKSDPSFWGGDVPWFSVKDAPADGDVFVLDTCEKITQAGLDKSSTKLLPEGVTIISARGTVGRLALVGTPMAMNQSCYGVNGAQGIGPYYNYFNLKQAVAVLQQNTHGAVFDTITRTTFDTVKTVKGDGDLALMFDEKVSGLMGKIKENLRESNVLLNLRDTLLPKLLSGELDISDVIIPEAGND